MNLNLGNISTSPVAEADSQLRKPADSVGFCWTSRAIEAVSREVNTREKDALQETRRIIAGKKVIAAIAPHDDHLLAARVAWHAVRPEIAEAGSVVIFGVTHKTARKALNEPHGVLIFDDFTHWSGPYGAVTVDQSLRQFLLQQLPSDVVRVNRQAHALEHSIEALLPLLQWHNRAALRILPVMISEVDQDELERLSNLLAAALDTYVKQQHLTLGKDLAFLISNDAIHYGSDFSYQPFGVNEAAYQKAMEQDRTIAQKFLAGSITPSKMHCFADTLWQEPITWCGRFAVPVGLLTLQKLVAQGGESIEGFPVRQDSSYAIGALPLGGVGIGTTAPYSLQHFVGYWSILYGM